MAKIKIMGKGSGILSLVGADAGVSGDGDRQTRSGGSGEARTGLYGVSLSTSRLRPVAGFDRVLPSFSAGRIKITVIDSTSIVFSGTDPVGAAIFGTVDRITGDVEAATEHWNYETNKLQWATGYSLKCKPT
jgi:hypothetical protein